MPFLSHFIYFKICLFLINRLIVIGPYYVALAGLEFCSPGRPQIHRNLSTSASMQHLALIKFTFIFNVSVSVCAREFTVHGDCKRVLDSVDMELWPLSHWGAGTRTQASVKAEPSFCCAYLCVMCGCMWATDMWGSQRTAFRLPFHYVGPRDRTQIPMSGSLCLCLLSHPTRLTILFLK